MADLLTPSTTIQADKKDGDSSRFCPILYGNINKEADVSLNPGYFKGFNVNYSSAFFKNFDMSSSLGPKHYAFRASYFFQKFVYFTGNVTHDGLIASVTAPIMSRQLFMNSMIELRKARLSTVLNIEYVALNYRAQVNLFSTGQIRATYIQRVTPHLYLGSHFLSSGGHFFWTREPQKSVVGYVARYETDDKMVASAKVESSGDVFMTYVQKISKKVSLATDFVYNCFSRDVKASVGYDYKSRLSRVQGKIDSNGVVYAHLKRKLDVGLRCLLTASLDLKNMNQRLGLRLLFG